MSRHPRVQQTASHITQMLVSVFVYRVSSARTAPESRPISAVIAKPRIAHRPSISSMQGSNPELRAQLQKRKALIERDTVNDRPANVTIHVHENDTEGDIDKLLALRRHKTEPYNA